MIRFYGEAGFNAIILNSRIDFSEKLKIVVLKLRIFRMTTVTVFHV